MAWGVKLSLGVVGKLGGASVQAVAQSKRPIAWLKARLRREITPLAPSRSYYCPTGFRADLLANRAVIIKRVAAVVAGFNPKGRGQPAKASAVELSIRFGYKDVVADPIKRANVTVVGVITRFVSGMVEELLRVVQQPSHTRWHVLLTAFDGIQPRWLNDRGVNEAFSGKWPQREADWGM